MYVVDESDRVVELSTVPPLNPGAPMPVVLADESVVQVAYMVHDNLTAWPGLNPALAEAEILAELYAIVKFDRACAHYLGDPNDEAFSAHPLFSRGLERYAISEVLESSWIRSLERMNSIHPQHRPEHFRGYRHFIFAFHDSTFECVAREFTVAFFRGAVPDLVGEMAKHAARDEVHRIGGLTRRCS